MDRLTKSDIARMSKEEIAERFNVLVEALNGVHNEVDKMEQPVFTSPIKAHLLWQEVSGNILNFVLRPFADTPFAPHGVQARPIELPPKPEHEVKIRLVYERDNAYLNLRWVLNGFTEMVFRHYREGAPRREEAYNIACATVEAAAFDRVITSAERDEMLHELCASHADVTPPLMTAIRLNNPS